MTDNFNAASGITRQNFGLKASHATGAGTLRDFLPEITAAQIEKIKSELPGMIGQRVILSSEEIVQIRRAVNVLLQEPGPVLVTGTSMSRVVAILSSEPAVAGAAVASCFEGGATHLAMNLPRHFQSALDQFQTSHNTEVLAELIKQKGFKHPLSLFTSAAELGIRLVAVGDESSEQNQRKVASVESVALDVANILDQGRQNKVVLWAGNQYLKRSRDRKLCNSSIDYLGLNYSIFCVHNGSYHVDGGPLRKIVFDLQCPGIIVNGRTRIIDHLPTGLESDSYGDWNAILLQPRPALDFSYFLTNE